MKKSTRWEIAGLVFFLPLIPIILSLAQTGWEYWVSGILIICFGMCWKEAGKSSASESK